MDLLRNLLRERKWKEAAELVTSIVRGTQLSPRWAERHFNDIPPRDRKIYPVLYLPVEIKSREWASKCLIADAALKRGFTVVLGQSWSLLKKGYIDWLPGIVLFKTLNAMDGGTMRMARGNGHLIAALDEEAIARQASSRFIKLNTDPWAAGASDVVLAQGQDHAGTLREVYPEVRLSVTGNPRAEVMDIPKTGPWEAHDNYTLVCCMSGNINNTRPFELVATDSLGMIDSELGREAFLEACLSEIQNIQHVIAAVENKTGPVVVRPHPVESHDLWKSWFGEQPNVTISNQGPMLGWAGAAKETLYVAGCGSGVECRLANLPSEAIGEGQDIRLTSGHIEPGNAAERIVEALWGLYEANKTDQPIDHEKLMRRLAHFTGSDFHRNKFPVTSLDEVKSRFEGHGTWEIEENVFMLSEPNAIPKGMEERLLKKLSSGIIKTSTDKIDRYQRIRENMRSGAKSFISLKNHHKSTIPAIICGSGPSLANQLPVIRKLVDAGGKIYAANTAHDYLWRKGFKVHYGVMCDGRPHIKVYMTPHRATRYLFGSTAHPEVLKKFKDFKVYLWHTINSKVFDEDVAFLKSLNEEFAGVSLGTTTCMRTISLAHYMGHRQLHGFGWDSCAKFEELPDGTTKVHSLHSTGKPKHLIDESYSTQEYTCPLRGKHYKWITNDAMAVQAMEFEKLIYNFGTLINTGRMEEFLLLVHGGGMLPFFASEHDMHAIPEENRTMIAGKIYSTPSQYTPEQYQIAAQHLKRKGFIKDAA